MARWSDQGVSDVIGLTSGEKEKEKEDEENERELNLRLQIDILVDSQEFRYFIKYWIKTRLRRLKKLF